MAAFDEIWWDDRSLRNGRVEDGLPAEGAHHAAWTRWRLIDELLHRYYNDIGLEPIFGQIGVELYQVALASPTCRRRPQYFGRLCGTGLHPEADLGAEESLAVKWAGLRSADLHRDSWPDWASYRKHAIDALGLHESGVTGHERCFHRRGKALTPLMYRIALLLRTDHGAGVVPDREMTTVTERMPATDPLQRVIRDVGETVPPGPPRFIGVRLPSVAVALRTDGWVASGPNTIDASALWRSGADVAEIASIIEQTAMA